jgi:hypothetical protein
MVPWLRLFREDFQSLQKILCYVEPVLGGSLLQSRMNDGFQRPLVGSHDASPLNAIHCAFSNDGKVKTNSIIGSSETRT